MKNVKDTPNIPKRRASRKAQPKVDFLDAELRAATTAALIAKTEELKIVTDVGRSVKAAREFYGQTPKWLAQTDLCEIVQVLRGLITEVNGEKELLMMIAGLKGGRK